MARALDNSTLRSVVTCHTRAVLEHVHGFRAVDGSDAFALRAGSALHEGLATLLRDNRLADGTACAPESAMLDGYELANAVPGDRHARYEGYRLWADQHVNPDMDWQKRFSTENVRRVLAAWIAAHAPIALPFTVPDPKLIEVGFTFPLDEHGDVLIAGRLDGFVLDREGAWRVLEHKSTGQLTERYIETYNLDSQPSTYLEAALAHVPGVPHVKGLFLNVLELSKLPDSNRACKTHGVEYRECGGLHLKAMIALITRTPAQLAEWRFDALALAAEFRQLVAEHPDLSTIHTARQQGKFTRACQRCDFFRYCDAGRPTYAQDDFLIHDPWSPL